MKHNGWPDGFTERRVMAWMLYLNDVKEGGETEFPQQDIKFKPESWKYNVMACIVDTATYKGYHHQKK